MKMKNRAKSIYFIIYLISALCSPYLIHAWDKPILINEKDLTIQEINSLLSENGNTIELDPAITPANKLTPSLENIALLLSTGADIIEKKSVLLHSLDKNHVMYRAYVKNNSSSSSDFLLEIIINCERNAYFFKEEAVLYEVSQHKLTIHEAVSDVRVSKQLGLEKYLNLKVYNDLGRIYYLRLKRANDQKKYDNFSYMMKTSQKLAVLSHMMGEDDKEPKSPSDTPLRSIFLEMTTFLKLNSFKVKESSDIDFTLKILSRYAPISTSSSELLRLAALTTDKKLAKNIYQEYDPFYNELSEENFLQENSPTVPKNGDAVISENNEQNNEKENLEDLFLNLELYEDTPTVFKILKLLRHDDFKTQRNFQFVVQNLKSPDPELARASEDVLISWFQNEMSRKELIDLLVQLGIENTFCEHLIALYHGEIEGEKLNAPEKAKIVEAKQSENAFIRAKAWDVSTKIFPLCASSTDIKKIGLENVTLEFRKMAFEYVYLQCDKIENSPQTIEALTSLMNSTSDDKEMIRSYGFQLLKKLKTKESFFMIAKFLNEDFGSSNTTGIASLTELFEQLKKEPDLLSISLIKNLSLSRNTQVQKAGLELLNKFTYEKSAISSETAHDCIRSLHEKIFTHSLKRTIVQPLELFLDPHTCSSDQCNQCKVCNIQWSTCPCSASHRELLVMHQCQVETCTECRDHESIFKVQKKYYEEALKKLHEDEVFNKDMDACIQKEFDFKLHLLDFVDATLDVGNSEEVLLILCKGLDELALAPSDHYYPIEQAKLLSKAFTLYTKISRLLSGRK